MIELHFYPEWEWYYDQWKVILKWYNGPPLLPSCANLFAFRDPILIPIQSCLQLTFYCGVLSVTGKTVSAPWENHIFVAPQQAGWSTQEWTWNNEMWNQLTDKRQKAKGKRQKAKDKRQKTKDKRQKTKDKYKGKWLENLPGNWDGLDHCKSWIVEGSTLAWIFFLFKGPLNRVTSTVTYQV